MLIILSGLPGAGKTSVARELARRLKAVHLRIDTIEDALGNAAGDTAIASPTLSLRTISASASPSSPIASTHSASRATLGSPNQLSIA